MNKIIIILLALVLCGCSDVLELKLEPEVDLFLSDGSKKQIHLTQKDEAYTILNEWLQDNKDGWFPTSGRYPKGVYIKSGNYGIQVTKLQVIIYKIINSEPKAIFIQDIKDDELNKVFNLKE